MQRALPQSTWTKQQIDRECATAYSRYVANLERHYVDYFKRYPHLRSASHAYSAKTLNAALPPNCEDLQDLIPRHSIHRFARSAKSSQTLALALLGSAWLNRSDHFNLPIALGFDAPRSESPYAIRFEHSLLPSDLNETPRVTCLDLTLASSEQLIAIETKWIERGLGVCSCIKDGDGSPAPGFDCSARVRSRRQYWETADELFGLPAVRLAFLPCSMSLFYQAVRYVAAVKHLAAGRKAAFVLIYDANNPYFTSTGTWPGWPAVLRDALPRNDRRFRFEALPWQRLVTSLPLPSTVRTWAKDKHRW